MSAMNRLSDIYRKFNIQVYMIDIGELRHMSNSQELGEITNLKTIGQ